MFPFKYKGKTYSTCTNKNKHVTNNLPWCYTNEGRGNWGNCDETCPLPPDEKNNSDEKEADSGLLINMYNKNQKKGTFMTFVTV